MSDCSQQTPPNSPVLPFPFTFEATSSTQFEFNGNKTYKRKFLLTENAETIYAEWLLIMATVYNTLSSPIVQFFKSTV